MKELDALSNRFIVMAERGRTLLETVYGVSETQYAGIFATNATAADTAAKLRAVPAGMAGGVFTALYAALACIWFWLIRRYVVEGPLEHDAEPAPPTPPGDDDVAPLSFAY